MSDKRRVVILGGGLGGLTTAWALAGPHNHEAEDLDITVLERGWTLGGKAASTRSSQYGERIEEHGLHLFLGFYVHAFRVLRDAYRYSGLDRDAEHPITNVESAFLPQHMATTFEFDRPQRFQRWDIAFPGDETLRPWDWRADEPPEITLPVLVKRLLGWLEEAFEPEEGRELPFFIRVIRGFREVIDEGWGMLRREVRDEIQELKNDLSSAMGFSSVSSGHKQKLEERSKRLQDKVQHFTTQSAASWEKTADETTAERLAVAIELCTTAVRGLIVDGILTEEKTFDDLDGEELREWFLRHGCSENAVRSPVLDVYYHLAFAYQDGSADFDKRNTAAGVALRALLLMAFGYRGSFMYRMKLGMGETVILPLYLALKQRGVKFRFFSEVKELEVEDGEISGIKFWQQVELKEGPDSYQPLSRTDDGVLFWPDVPYYDQIVDGDQLKEGPGDGLPYDLNHAATTWDGGKDIHWKVEEDFDDVVLAISVAALPEITSSLSDEDDNWKRMLEHVATVPTRAAQLWFCESARRFGWRRVVKPGMRGPELAVATGLQDPFDTWADMSHLLHEEDWQIPVKQVAYLCSAAPRPESLPTTELQQHELNEETREATRRWLDAQGIGIWPDANEPGTDCFDLRFFIQDIETGEPDLDAGIYSRWNVDPSEQYVQSLAGTTRYRLGATDTPWDNLVLAGDWTRNPLNVGCVEATVLSGLHAAEALGVEYLPTVWDEQLKAGRSIGEDVLSDEIEAEEVRHRSVLSDTTFAFPEVAQPTMRPPYTMEEVLQYNFAVKADQRQMQRFVDQRLNSILSDSVRYVVQGHYAFVQAQRSLGMKSKEDACGSVFDQDEIALMLIVERHERTGGGGFRPTPGGMRFFPAILFNNCVQGMLSGREVYGFDKRPATILAEEYDGFPVDWQVNADVYTRPDVVTDRREVIRMFDDSNNAKKPSESLFSVMSWFIRFMRKDARADWRSLLSNQIPILNVRTITDPSSDESQLRRELTECRFNIELLKGVRAGKLPSSWKVTLSEPVTSALADPIGLKVDPDGQLILESYGVWMRYSATLDGGKILSRRTGPPPYEGS